MAGLRTVSNVVFDRVSDAIKFEQLESRVEPKRILLCDPKHFEVKDNKNPFMEGNLNNVDRELAVSQWNAIKHLYESLGSEVQVLDAVEGFEDMVFTANQVLPFHSQFGKAQVLLAEMRHPSRQREVPYFAKWFESHEYGIHRLSDVHGGDSQLPKFEGQGDAIWHPNKNLLWGGYGQRTDQNAYELVAKIVESPVAKLKLAHPRFYHLDTCFCVLDEQSVMIFEPAFDAEGLALIRHYFKNVVSVPEVEANNFVCNSVVIDKRVLVQKGSPLTSAMLKELGFEVVDIDVSEFMKSGGGIFCLKMMIY